MQTSRIVRGALVIVFGLISLTAFAREITLQHKGLTLNADIQFAEGKGYAHGVVLITHGGLAHRDMEFVSYLRKLLFERGYNTLAINLGLGIDNRHGMYDCKLTHRHRNEDAVEEIGVWVEWLKRQGASHVTLLGHSRGGAQTALYSVERDPAWVNAVILMSPATRDNAGAGYEQRYQKPLQPLLSMARELSGNGRGDTVLRHVNLMACRDTAVTADSFLSYYGQDPLLDSPDLIPRIRKPVLVLVAGEDREVTGLERKVAPLVDGKRVQMKVIVGSDHMFRDLNTDDAVDAVDSFLQGLQP